PALAFRTPGAWRIRHRRAGGGGARVGAPPGVPHSQSRLHDAGGGGGRPSRDSGGRRHRRIPRRDQGGRTRRTALAAARTQLAGGSAQAHGLFKQKILGRGRRPAPPGPPIKAPNADGGGRRIAGHRSDPRGPPQHALSFGLYRLAGAHARLARRGADELRRSRRGRAPFGGRLSGRRAMDRRRGREDLVRADQVAPIVPSDPGRDAGGHPAVGDLRRPRLLNNPAALKAALVGRARPYGFDTVGIARPDSIQQAAERLRHFLAEGAHGDMDWMETTAVRRERPGALWPQVRSIIMLGLNYGDGPDSDPLAILQRCDRGAISVYARGDDYHDVIKSRLKALASWLTAQAGGDVKVFVDTAAVMEKPLAAAAGLGWQGKHTNLVSRQFGSWLFLGAIFTTLDLPPDAPEIDHCGTCRACLDICPTAAFPAPYRLDARR